MLPPATPSTASTVVRREFAGLVRMDGRDAEIAAFEAAMVGFFVDAADLLGVPKSVAALYGICFAAPEPLSVADIYQKLDLSNGSISQGIRFLREIGALQEVSTPADRLARFEPDMKLRKLAAHWLEERLQKQLTSGQSHLAAIGKLIPPDKNGSTKNLSARLQALQDWHDRTQSLLPIIKTFLKLA
jgi:DNA-binding transcriptional regulator GbsR (MarR family)